MSDWFMQKALNFEGLGSKERFDKLPDHCPRCYVRGTPTLLNELAYISPDKTMRIELKCPNRRCGKPFFALYRLGYERGVLGDDYGYILNALEPLEPQRLKFSEYIEDLSERFVGVFNQANRADLEGLDEIAGPGYRKALEILVKDYAKAPYLKILEEAEDGGAEAIQAQDHINAIESLLLAPCINKYLDDKRIREVAARAAWLGNDEVHYVRRWPDKDVKELKALLDLVIRFIDSQLEYESVLLDMPKGR
jgi:hypothetical protein